MQTITSYFADVHFPIHMAKANWMDEKLYQPSTMKFTEKDVDTMMKMIKRLDSVTFKRQARPILKELRSYLSQFQFNSEQYDFLCIIAKLIRCRIISIQINRMIDKL